MCLDLAVLYRLPLLCVLGVCALVPVCLPPLPSRFVVWSLPLLLSPLVPVPLLAPSLCESPLVLVLAPFEALLCAVCSPSLPLLCAVCSPS